MFELDRILKEETKVEKEQRKSGFNVTDPDILDELILSGNKFRLNGNFLLSEEMFFKKGDVHIRKHNRYSDMPLHHHQFLELNYMYSGSCTQEVSGEKIVLNEGDIIMLDRGSSHSFQALGENDILINVLLKVETVNTKILQQLVRKRGVLTEFLVLASQRTHEEDQFLVFRTGENAKVQTFMQYILEEYYGGTEPNTEVIHLYLPLLFMELARTFEEETKGQQGHQNQVVTEALAIIEKDYRTLSLEMLAQQLGSTKLFRESDQKRDGRHFQAIAAAPTHAARAPSSGLFKLFDGGNIRGNRLPGHELFLPVLQKNARQDARADPRGSFAQGPVV